MSAGDDELIQRYLDLFDPSKDPVLQPGWVSDTYKADEQQLARAAKKLKARRAKWFWRLFNDVELEAIKQSYQALQASPDIHSVPESEAEKPLPGAGASPFASPSERLDDLQLLITAISSKRAALKRLDFYDDCVLVHVEPETDGQDARRWLMIGPGEKILRLGNDTGPIHRMNALGLQLNDDNVEDYAAFFCAQTVFSRGGLAPCAFVPIEEDTEQDSTFPARLDAKTRDTRAGNAVIERLESHARLQRVETTTLHASAFPKAAIGVPITLIGKGADPADPAAPENWLLVCTLLYRGDVFRAALSVAPKGTVGMLDDSIISDAGLTPVSMSWPPPRVADKGPEPA